METSVVTASPSRTESLVANALEMQDDAVFVIIRKASSVCALARDDSHISRSDRQANKLRKKRSFSARRDSSSSDVCVLTALRQADEDGKLKAEFIAAADAGLIAGGSKPNRSIAHRHSYNLEPLNKQLARAHEKRNDGQCADSCYMVQTVKKIRAGTLDRLVDCLVACPSDETQIDNLYTNTFLATFRKFASSVQVLESILQHCAATSSVNGGDSERVMQAYTSVLLLWIKTYPEDFLLSATPIQNQNGPSESERSRKTRRASEDVARTRRSGMLLTIGSAAHADLRTGRLLGSARGTQQKGSSSLNALVRPDVLETFARFEGSCKHDRFIQLLRKIREWLAKVLQDFRNNVSGMESDGAQTVAETKPGTKTTRPVSKSSQRNSMSPQNGDSVQRRSKGRTSQSASPTESGNSPDADFLVQADNKTLTDQLLAFDARGVAYALTLIDSRLFRAVRLHECLGATWSQPLEVRARCATSVMRTIAQFNKLVQLIQSSVLDDANWGSRTLEDRARLVSFWIDVARNLRTLKNFSSLKATVTSLTSSSLFRLSHVWSLVAPERRDALAELERLVSEENNHVLSRELLQREGAAKVPILAHTNDSGVAAATTDVNASSTDTGHVQPVAQFGTIPYLGIFLTDLLYIHTAHNEYVEIDAPANQDEPAVAARTAKRNSVVVEVACGKRKLVNFDKCRREFEVLARIKLLQSSTNMYLQNLKPDTDFDAFYSRFRASSVAVDHASQSFITSSRNTPIVTLLNEEECYNLSLKVEHAVARSVSDLNNAHRSNSISAPKAASTPVACDEPFRTRSDTDSRVGNARPILKHLRSPTNVDAASPQQAILTNNPVRNSPILDSQVDDTGRAHSISALPTASGTNYCVPVIGTPSAGPQHRKAKSTDEKSGRIRNLPVALNVLGLTERSDSETTRNVKVKIDLDHPIANARPSLTGFRWPTVHDSPHHHGWMSTRTAGRSHMHSSALNFSLSKSQPAPPTTTPETSDFGFNSLRSRTNPKMEKESCDLRRVATILNQFQSLTQYVEYKTIQVINSDRKAQVIRKILAKFNLDMAENARDCLNFCTNNFDLVQLLNDGNEVLIGDNTNVFYALKSEANRSSGTVASPADEYVLALRFK